MMKYDFNTVIKFFKADGKLISAEKYGDGHINDTFLIKMQNGNNIDKYILQKINNHLFVNIDKLMNNIKLVTQFNRKKVIERGGNPDREGLTIIETVDNKPYYFDGENYFRVYLFIDNATTYNIVQKPEHFYESAVAFGNFANLLAEFDSSQLYEVLPGFHCTPKRFSNFIIALKNDKLGRAKSVKDEIEFVLKREKLCNKINDLLISGKMPMKVTHNDTKFNNVMIDNETGKGIAVIDLDTVMPGSICYDFGDAIRSGCNPACEDEKDLSLVNFRFDLFELYAKGYLKALGKSVAQIEKDNLAVGAIIMTLECGIRFLTDYLEGDLYFKTNREGQNLDRTRTQFKLVTDMENNIDTMNNIIKSIH